MFEFILKRAMAVRILGGMLVTIGLTQLATISNAFAQNLNSAPMIFDVRRSLPLEPDEPVYHDFYINAGPEVGFRKGMFINVVRMVPVHDPVQNKQQATLDVNVAKLQVIHVERNITVARLQYEFTDDERPTLEYESVMIGDRIDPATMTMEAPGSLKKKSKAPPAKASVQLKREEPVAKAEPASAPQTAPQAPPQATEKASEKPLEKSADKAAEKPADKLPTQAQASSPVGVPGGSKNASPGSSSPDMVRVPVPSASSQKL